MTTVKSQQTFKQLDSQAVQQFETGEYYSPVTISFHEKATDAMRDLLFKGADKVRPTI